MEKLINLQSYPLHQLDSAVGQQLVALCVDDLERKGMFTLKGFMRREVIDEILPGLLKKLKRESFTHARGHNIYFNNDIKDIPADHPALTRVETINHTLCGDQIAEPLHTQFGWHILQVQGRRESDMTNEASRAKAMDYLHNRKYQEELDAWLRQIRDEAYVDIK